MPKRLAHPLFLLALLAAAPLAAQKPPADNGADGAREQYRGQGVSLCVAELRTADGLTPDDLEAICGCAFDRWMPGHDVAALPAAGPALFRSALWPHLMSCAADRDPRLSVAVAGRLAQSPAAAAAPPAVISTPPPVSAVPVPAGDAADKPASGAGAGAGLQSWWNGLAAPSWLSGLGLPLWAWIVLLPILFVFLRVLLRRHDGRGDLTGPPRHMRPSGRAPHLPPRG